MAEPNPFLNAMTTTGGGQTGDQVSAESGGGDGESKAEQWNSNTGLTKAMGKASAINQVAMPLPIIHGDPIGGSMSKPAQFMHQAANKISTNNASNHSCQKQGSGHKGKRKATDSTEENSDDVVEEGPTKSGPAKKQKKEVTGVPTQPTGAMLQYNTAFYTLYDPKLEKVGTSTHAPFASFASYNDYTLYMNPNVTDVSEIPTSGLRLDDMTVALVVKECGNKKLKECWPAEFDTRAMVSGRRLPLGHAAKEYKKEGDVDVDGNILSKDQEGWYYLWLKGLHELSGQEGLDYKTYLKRPAFEKDRVPGLTWKISSRANIQLKSGDPRDHTFDKLKDYPTLKTTTATQPDTTAPSSSKIMTVSEPDATAP